ncbi:MAG: hypothetical protein M0T73_06800 [Deltaproteobacteria bacterium]|nr:hypothetical protein [Deltaproteobacteria bacterium]
MARRPLFLRGGFCFDSFFTGFSLPLFANSPKALEKVDSEGIYVGLPNPQILRKLGVVSRASISALVVGYPQTDFVINDPLPSIRAHKAFFLGTVCLSFSEKTAQLAPTPVSTRAASLFPLKDYSSIPPI